MVMVYADLVFEAAGCKAILLTADSPVLGIRWNETRNHLALPEGLGFPIMGEAVVKAGKSSKDVFSSLNGKEVLRWM
jgi:(S)-2-hydroxy-acid oxidase